MTGCLMNAMRRYGQEVILIPRGPGDVRVVRAFLQPVRKIREELPVTPTPLGGVNRQRWLYIGPPEARIAPGDRVRMDETYLTVQEAVTVRWGDFGLYRRAVLRQEKEAAD